MEKESIKDDLTYKCVVLPHLSYSLQVLRLFQEENGSWSDSPFVTSIALLSFYSFSRVHDQKVLMDEMAKARLYLLKNIRKLVAEVLKRRSLYKDLDSISRDFGIISYCLSQIGEKEFIDKEWSEAFEKIMISLHQYLQGFGNVESLSFFLLSLSANTVKIQRDLSRKLRRIIKYLIEECLSNKLEPWEAYIACFSMGVISRSSTKGILLETWDEVVEKRVDEWHGMSFEDGIKKLGLGYSQTSLEHCSPRDLAYLILAFTQIGLLEELLRSKIVERSTSLINELLIKAQSSSILDLALLSWALAESNFLEVIVLPKEKEIPLKKACLLYTSPSPRDRG